MKYRITLIFCVLFLIANHTFSQTATCDGTLPFEEKNGLLTIEMESGILPSGSDWQTGSEPDPNLSGATIDYIFWNGAESFSSLSNAPITYNIKINNPGTYRIALRGRIGKGNSGGEHNDVWLFVEADDFYATQSSNSTSTGSIEPKPSCSNNPDRNCPEGNSTNGYFKAFMNRHPVNSSPDRKWGFVTNSVFNKNSYRFIWATFNTARNYSIIIDARSNSFFMDKMVLRRSNVFDSVAFNVNNSESTCYDASLSTNAFDAKAVKMYPNPTEGKIELNNLPENTNLTITNIFGARVFQIQTKDTKHTIDISNLKSGVYFIANDSKTNHFVKKIIKL